MLSEESIKEYQKIYEKEFGEKISYENAYESGSKLLELMKIVYSPIKKDELNSKEE